MRDFTFALLKGLTLTDLRQTKGLDSSDDVIVIETACGKSFRMHHEQDCCESVTIDNIAGKIPDVLGRPLIEATEEIERSDTHSDDSWTRTTFTLRTKRGALVIRWDGSSKGYYSESVSFQEVTPTDKAREIDAIHAAAFADEILPMKSKTKKPAVTAAKKPAAKAKPPRRFEIEIRRYPHVMHVHHEGEERPELRKMAPSDHDIETMRATMSAIPGAVVTVGNYDAQGNKLR